MKLLVCHPLFFATILFTGIEMSVCTRAVHAEETTQASTDEDSTKTPGQITASQIKDGAVTATKIGTNAIIAAKIASNAVTTTKVATNAITTAKLADGAVTSIKIADNAITSDKIADDAITTDKIANDAVTNDKLAENLGDISVNALTVEGVTYFKDNIVLLPNTGSIYLFDYANAGVIAAPSVNNNIFYLGYDEANDRVSLISKN